MAGRPRNGEPERRRQKGTGSLETLPDGRIRIQVVLGRTPEGKRDRAYVYGATAEEAEAAGAELKRARRLQLEDGAGSKQRTADFLETWLQGKATQRLEWSTTEDYRQCVARVSPLIGHHRLRDLTAAHIRMAYAVLLKTLAPATVTKTHVALKQALDQAVGDGILVRNVADAVKPPKRPPSEARALETEEALALLRAAQCPHHARERDWYVLWVLGIYTGMRLGELLGLPWSDELMAGRVNVRRVLADGDGPPVLRDYPKRHDSVRTLRIPPFVVEELALHRARQQAERALHSARWVDHNLVFCSRYGTPLLRSNVERHFKYHCAGAGIALPPRQSIHVLRHTYATHLLTTGKSPYRVAQLMGHSSVSTVLRVYAHYLAPEQADEADLLSQRFGHRTTLYEPVRQTGIKALVSDT